MFSLCREDLAEPFGRESPVSSEPPSGSQGESCGMPARAGLSDSRRCNSSESKWLSEVCTVVLKGITEEIAETEGEI